MGSKRSRDDSTSTSSSGAEDHRSSKKKSKKKSDKKHKKDKKRSKKHSKKSKKEAKRSREPEQSNKGQEAWLPTDEFAAREEKGRVGSKPIAVPVLDDKPHTGVFQGWPVAWTCCRRAEFVCPCEPAEEAAVAKPVSEMTDDEKRLAAVQAAKRMMEMQSRGVGVVSSAAAPDGEQSAWWKGTIIAKKPDLGADKQLVNGYADADWTCQSYKCDARNYRRNDKCFKCGATRRTGKEWGR
eukprot:TRINITY_DN9248_c0_g2_i1.p1 TRINITY_DN9248_c0_g2~~TRINITY_DN9248_c0_g2_i1.p1  ORF type:complete len:239 (-),score=75.64 TRINITY_DN9248_c0_g2_i1:484-1200(-)